MSRDSVLTRLLLQPKKKQLSGKPIREKRPHRWKMFSILCPLCMCVSALLWSTKSFAQQGLIVWKAWPKPLWYKKRERKSLTKRWTEQKQECFLHAHPWCIVDRPLGPRTHTQSERAEPLSHSSVSLCSRRLQTLPVLLGQEYLCESRCVHFTTDAHFAPQLGRDRWPKPKQKTTVVSADCLLRIPRCYRAEWAPGKMDDIYQAIERRDLAPSAQGSSEMEYWFKSVA